MKKLLFSLLFILTLSAGYAHAQTQTASQFCQNGSCTYVSLEPLPGLPDCYGPNPPSSCKNPGGSFANLVGNSFKLLIGAGGMIAVVMIVIGALTYMFSDVVGNKTKALARIRNAMWAIVILVSSFLILNTINPELVTFSLNLSSAGNTGSFANTPANTTAPVQQTSAQIQAQQNSCTQTCGSIGGALHPNADGSYTCQCSTGVLPI